MFAANVQIIAIHWQRSEKKTPYLHFIKKVQTMKFAIFGNTYQAKKSTHAETLFRLLERRNAQLCICREFYNFLTSDLHMTIASAELFDGDDFTARIWSSVSGATVRS